MSEPLSADDRDDGMGSLEARIQKALGAVQAARSRTPSPFDAALAMSLTGGAVTDPEVPPRDPVSLCFPFPLLSPPMSLSLSPLPSFSVCVRLPSPPLHRNSRHALLCAVVPPFPPRLREHLTGFSCVSPPPPPPPPPPAAETPVSTLAAPAAAVFPAGAACRCGQKPLRRLSHPHPRTHTQTPLCRGFVTAHCSAPSTLSFTR